MAVPPLIDPAQAIIERHTQDVPVRVGDIARDLGIPVVFDTSLTKDVAGKIVKESVGSPSGYRIYVNGNDTTRRRRFSLAHEIAHYILHRDLIGDGLIDDALYRSKLGGGYERQANRMAADILMPAGLVRGLYRGGMISFARLSEILDVSEEAIRIRLSELRLGP
jgi:Zn-dependent peptidase ImmA (M78 family)